MTARPRERLLVALSTLLLGLVLVAAGCAEDATGSGPSSSAETSPGDVETLAPSEVATAIEDGAVVIDVRTPPEFAEGHLEGARNIDVSASDFDAQIDELDRDATYVVYCETGNRASTAVDRMGAAGFDDVTNAGGYDALAEAGLDTTRAAAQ